jgi:hypothetical protein
MPSAVTMAEASPRTRVVPLGARHPSFVIIGD